MKSKPLSYTKYEEFSSLENNIRFLRGKISKEDRILEIGSGCGGLANYLMEHGYNITPTELSPSSIEIGNKRFPDLGIIRMSGDYLMFPDSSFDVVISFDVLEHIPSTAKHLSEVRRVLKKGGKYIFQTPNKITNMLIAHTFKLFSKERRWGPEYHCSLHTYSQLKKALIGKGFSPNFYKMNPVTSFTIKRIRNGLGTFAANLFRIFPFGLLPFFLQTNFYMVAKKR